MTPLSVLAHLWLHLFLEERGAAGSHGTLIVPWVCVWYWGHCSDYPAAAPNFWAFSSGNVPEENQFAFR